MGVMVWKGETYEGKYTPLVSAELFQAVQRAMKVRSKPRRVRHGHNFPFCGVFRCTCGSMMTAQWAKGHGGTYRYYRCTRKAGVCHEPYVQEGNVATQCMDRLRPFALAPDEAKEIRELLEAEAETERQSKTQAIQKSVETLLPIEEKLKRLTRLLLDGVLDEDSYRIAKEELVIEKTRLKQERQRVSRTGENSWIEPTRRLVEALETLGKTETAQNYPEIRTLVQKFGTNPLISRKTVTFSFSREYDFVPSLLAKTRLAISENQSATADKNWWSTKWCSR